MPPLNEPYMTGRFNYLSFRADLFNVMYVPYAGATAFIVARNLDKETALALIEDLNESLDDAKRSIQEQNSVEEEE